MTPRVVDLNEMLPGFSKLLARLVEESVHLDVVLGRQLPPIRIDPSQLEQVVLNLVVNARDAMPQGGTIAVRTGQTTVDDQSARHRKIDPGRYVTLAVSDTGTGMPPSVQAQIFEPFFTTKPRGQGTGLGLATVYGIVSAAGGTLDVHSAEGEGTTFTLYFPAIPAGDDDGDAEERELKRLRGTETVLVVEDNAPLRRLTVRMLERYGYRVIEADRLARAQEACSQHGGPIDVAVLDVIMPDGSGPEIADWLAAEHPATRVIFVSGYTDDSFDRQRVKQSGTSLLQKPYTAAQLAATIREVLSEVRSS